MSLKPEEDGRSRLTVRMPEELFLRFKDYCARKHRLMSDVVQELIEAELTELMGEGGDGNTN